MKTRLALLALTLLLGTHPASGKDSPAEPAAQREIVLVVVDSLHHQTGAITDFDRLDMAFRKIVRQRKWPVKLTAERFTADTPEHATELRIVNRPVRQETPGDLTFRGWLTLTVDGTKHDFGIVTYRYYPRPGEAGDETLQKLFEGVARTAADKAEPLLFPAAGAAR